MNSHNERRTAILTGAFGGIGRGILEHLRSLGYAVVAVDRVVPDEGERPAADAVLDVDITSSDQVSEVVEVAIRKFGGIDVLVNCAGILRDAPFERMPIEDFDVVVDVNLQAAMRLTAQALPALRASGSGRVVSIGSRAWLGVFGSSNYSASKGGMVGMTRALALAEGAQGITANAIAPGYIATPMTTHLTPTIPVGRGGTPLDIAQAVGFLASPEAGYITGQTLLVCGGRGLRP